MCIDPPSATIRRATLSDVSELAALQRRVWRETYRGLLPEDLLDDPGGQLERESAWHTVLRYAKALDAVFLLGDDTGRAVGFASAGPARESAMGYPAELYTIYLLREVQGQGWGQALWKAVTGHLEERPFYLWSHAANPTTGFYERRGGRRIAERRGRWGEVIYPECAYGFSNGRAL